MVSAKSPDWLPSGWTVKVKVNKGRKQKCYVDPTSSCEFYMKAQVFKYIESVTSAAVGQKKIDSQDIDNIGSSSGGKSHSKLDVSKNLKTVRNKSYISKQREIGIDKLSVKNVVFEKGSPDELPPEWIKGIRTKKTSNGTKKYTEYTDPSSGYIFSSKKDALRYLETGDIDKCAIKPKKRDTNDPNLMKDKISVAVQSDEIPEWLPHGWTMCYVDPTSGRKFHSKLEVTQYLETVNDDTNGLKNIEHNTERSTRSKSSLKPDSNPNEFESGISKKKKVGLGKNSVNNVVNERGSKGDLPSGGTKEIKTRKSVNVIEKEPLNIGRSTRSKSSLQPDTPQHDSPVNNVLIERGIPDELPSAKKMKETKTRKSVDGIKKVKTPSAVDVKKSRYHTRRQLFTGSSEGKQDISASPAAKESSVPKTRGSKRKRDVEISVENGPVSTPSTAIMEEEKLPEKGTVKRGNRKNEIDLSKSKNRRGVSLHGRSLKTSAEVKLKNTNGKKTSAPQTQPSKRKRGVDVSIENASVSTPAAAILQEKKLPESGTVKRGSRKTQIDLSKSKSKRRISFPDLSKFSNKRGVSLRGRSSKNPAEVKPKNANGKDSSDPKTKPSKRKRGVEVSVENGSVSTPASAILQEEKLSENGTVKLGSRKTQIDSSKSKNNRVGSTGRSSKTPVEVKKPKNANGKERFDPTTKGSKRKHGMEASAKTRSAKTLQGEKLPKDEAVKRSKKKTQTESSPSKGQRQLSLDGRSSKRLARFKPEKTTDFGSSEGAPWAAARKERGNIEANRCLDLALDAVADGEPKQLEAEPEREIVPRASVSKKITSAIEVSNQAEKPLEDQILEEPEIEEAKQNEKPLEEDQTVQEDQPEIEEAKQNEKPLEENRTVQEDQPEIEEAKQNEKPLEEDRTVQEEQSERQESKNIEELLKDQIISEGRPGRQEAKQSLKPLEENQTVQEHQPEMQKEKQSEKSLEEDQAIRDKSESIADRSPKFLEEDLAVQEDLPEGQEAKQSAKPLDDQAVLEEPPESQEANQSEKPLEEDQIIGEEQPEMGRAKESKRPLEEDQGVSEYQPKWQEANQTEKSLLEDQTIGEVQPEMEEAKQSGKTLEEDQAVQEDSPERHEANQSKKLLEEDQIVEEDQPELQEGKQIEKLLEEDKTSAEDQPELQEGKQIEKLLEEDKTSEEDQPENQKAKQTENPLEEDQTAPEEQPEWPEAKRIEEPLDDQTTPEEKPDGQEAKQIEKPLEDQTVQEDQLGRQEANQPDKPLLDRAATEEPEIPATEQIEKPPVEDQAAPEIQEGEKAESQDSELFPFMESWEDPCLDFAFKTLTGAVPAEEDSEAIQIPIPTQVDPFQNEVLVQYDAQEKPVSLQQWPASDVLSHFDAAPEKSVLLQQWPDNPAPEKSVLLQQWPDNPAKHLPSGDISLPSCSIVDSDAGEKEYQPKVN